MSPSGLEQGVCTRSAAVDWRGANEAVAHCELGRTQVRRAAVLDDICKGDHLADLVIGYRICRRSQCQ